jgi:hypothetical protein
VEEKWKHNYINNGQDEIKHFTIVRNTIPNASGVVFRKNLYQEVGGADERFQFVGDWFLWIKMLEKMDVAYVADRLNYFRRHTATTRDKHKIPGSGYMAEVYECMNYVYSRYKYRPMILDKALDDLFFLWHQGSVKIFWKNLNRENLSLATQIDRRFYSRAIRFFGNYLKTKLGSKLSN